MRNALKALLVTFMLACGACGGGADGPDLSRFVGTWTPTAGTIALDCAGQSSTIPSGIVTWAIGSSSDLIQPIANTTCVMHADVSGVTAEEPNTQTCAVSTTDDYGDPVTEMFSYSAYTFVINPDGKTATENLSGTVLVTNSYYGTSTTCTMSEAGASYQKQ
jgi:hypothetical protein